MSVQSDTEILEALDFSIEIPCAALDTSGNLCCTRTAFWLVRASADCGCKRTRPLCQYCSQEYAEAFQRGSIHCMPHGNPPTAWFFDPIN